MNNDCLVCERIQLIKTGDNPDFVAELETGYVVIGWHQLFYGYTLFFSKEHRREMHELSKKTRLKFLEEMSQVAEAVFRTFKPRKLNYELLGNSHEHLHWHLFPRHKDDPEPNGPVWWVPDEIRRSESNKPTNEELIEMKSELLKELCNVANVQKDFE